MEITKEDYISLLNAKEKLRRLERGGVGSWHWYHESLDRQCNDDFMSMLEARDILEMNKIKILGNVIYHQNNISELASEAIGYLCDWYNYIIIVDDTSTNS